MALTKMAAIRPQISVFTQAAAAAMAVTLLVLSSGSDVTYANSCTAPCHAQYNQCRVATKGSPSCDAKLRACLQACIKSKK